MDNFLKAFKEYEDVKKTTGSGDKYSFPLQQAKRDLESALLNIIDNRIKTYLGREKRKNTLTDASQSQQIDIVNTSLSLDVVEYIDALNSAPNPPSDHQGPEESSIWVRVYANWFNGKRKRALNK